MGIALPPYIQIFWLTAASAATVGWVVATQAVAITAARTQVIGPQCGLGPIGFGLDVAASGPAAPP